MFKEVKNPFSKGLFRNLTAGTVLIIIVSICIFWGSLDSKTYENNLEVVFYLLNFVLIYVIARIYNIDIKSFFGKILLPEKEKLKNISVIFYLIPFIYSVIFLFINFSKTYGNKVLKDFMEPDTSLYLIYNSDTQSLIHNFLVIFIACVLAPVTEEMIFRGIILHRFSAKWKVSDALIVSSIIFGILHGSAFATISVVGYLFAVIYLKTKNIIYPILAHSLYNFLIIICTNILRYEPINYLYTTPKVIFLIISLVIIFTTLPKIVKFVETSKPKEIEKTDLPYFQNFKELSHEEINFVFEDKQEKKKSGILKKVFIAFGLIFLLGIISGCAYVIYLDYKFTKDYPIDDIKISTLSGENKNPSLSQNLSSIVVSWQAKENNNFDIHSRIFNFSDNKMTKEINVNQTATGNQENPNVSYLGNEKYLIVWDGEGIEDKNGIYGRIFNKKGQYITQEFRVNNKVSGTQSKPLIIREKEQCGCNNYSIVWKNNDRNSISIKSYLAENNKAIENETEIKIPDEINYSNMSFSINKDDEIIVLAKNKEKIYLYTADISKKELINPILVSETGFNPNISKNKNGEFIISWEDSNPEKNLYLLKSKQYDKNLKAKLLNDVIVKKSETDRFRKPQVYLVDNQIISLWEQADGAYERGFFIGFFDAILKIFHLRKDNGINISENSQLFNDDSTQVNDIGFGEQTNFASDYLEYEDIDEEEQLNFISVVWQGQNKRDWDIYAKVYSYNENELLEISENPDKK